MDPNANLREQRAIVARINSSALNEGDAFDVRRLAELAEALDEWLSEGGFLPDAWKAGR